MTPPIPTFTGIHHVSLPVTDIGRSREWYEVVLGSCSIIDEETEDRITTVTLGLRTGTVFCLCTAPQRAQALSDFSPLCLTVSSRAELARWNQYFDSIGVAHSSLRDAHLGWALDVIDPDGIRIQLHTPEGITVDAN